MVPLFRTRWLSVTTMPKPKFPTLMAPLLVTLFDVGSVVLASAAMPVALWPTVIVPELATVLFKTTAMPYPPAPSPTVIEPALVTALRLSPLMPAPLAPAEMVALFWIVLSSSTRMPAALSPAVIVPLLVTVFPSRNWIADRPLSTTVVPGCTVSVRLSPAASA